MLKDRLVFGKKIDLYTEIKNWKVENKKIPVFIWGTGSVALEVYRYLSQNNIKIDGFFYDTKVNTTEPELQKGTTIYSLNDLLKQYAKFGVIVGHSHYEKIKEMNDLENVSELWAFAGIGHLGIEIDEEFVKENLENYEYTFSKLADECSKENMIAYLNAHLLNDSKRIIDNFKEPVNYFANDIFHFNEDEIYCDCGAYDGKSVRNFLDTVDNKYQKIILVEVMKDMYEKLQCMEELPKKNVSIWNIGLSDHVGEDKFEFDTQFTCLSDAGEKVQVTTLDKILENEAVSIMKIAINNPIDKILLGGAKTIKRELPKMVILAGIERRALLDYIPLIEKIAGEGRYQFFLRYTNAAAVCLSLFAVPYEK